MRMAALALVWASATACGGKLAPVETADGASPGDAGQDASADTSTDGAPRDALAEAVVDAGPPCDYDASWDATACTPPDDDTLYADPGVIFVPEGSYGIASFVASGPWASDPGMYVQFESSNVPLHGRPYVMINRPPTSFAFLIPPNVGFQQGSFVVSGHAGNIARIAQATVVITACQPWPQDEACAGNECGTEPDGCGGMESCGTCGQDAPFCFLGQCVSTQPTYCPDGDGFSDGACVPCETTMLCQQCHTGYCPGHDDVCVCEDFPADQ
jgi:hypothetical protein